MSPVSGGERRAIAKTVDEIIKIDKKAAGSHFPPYKLVWGTVTAIDAGPPSTLTVKLLGSSTTVSRIRYLSGYFPTVGDEVVGKKYGKDLVILCTLAKPPLYLVVGAPEGAGSTQVHVIDVTTNTLIDQFSGVGISGYVAINNTATLIALDSEDPAFVLEIPGGGTWSVSGSGSGYGPIFNADGTYLYSPTGFNNTIVKITVASRTLDATLTGLDNPRNLILSPDGDYIYALSPNGFLYQIELSTFTVTNTLSGLPESEGPYFCIDANNQYIYTTGESTNTLLQIDVSSFSVVNTLSFGSGVQPAGVCVSDDSSTVYVVGVESASIYVVDASSMTLTDTHVVSGGVEAPIAFYGGHVYVSAGGTTTIDALDPVTWDVFASISISDTTAPTQMSLQRLT